MVAEIAIGFMDAHQIDAGILSVSSPGVMGWEKNQRRDGTQGERIHGGTRGQAARSLR
jgi:hypothetical protein